MKPATARNYAHEVVTDVMHNTLPNLSVAQRARDQVEQLKEDNAKLVAALRECIEVLEEHRAAPVTRGHANALLRELGEL